MDGTGWDCLGIWPINPWDSARREDVLLAATLWNLLGLGQAVVEHARPVVVGLDAEH